jgi:hypothetical protein
MKLTAISTEGRIFVAQLTRDLAKREIAGANLLSPGATTWETAFRGFAENVSKSASGPIQASEMFRAAIRRLRTAQNQSACFVNSFMGRKRSAYIEVLTYERSKHPITETGYDGVAVVLYRMRLQRAGRISAGLGGKLAFLSWHALARMRERSKIDIFDANGVVAGCGMAGLLMRESDKHQNTEINFAVEGLICTGVMRHAPTGDGYFFGFYDVLTALTLDDEFKRREPEMVRQGIAIGHAAARYMHADNADPTGYADKIATLPFHDTDYVSRELEKRKNEPGQLQI